MDVVAVIFSFLDIVLIIGTFLNIIPLWSTLLFGIIALLLWGGVMLIKSVERTII